MFDRFLNDFEPQAARAQLEKDGLLPLSARFNAEECAMLLDFIDNVPAEQCELNYAGTEKRIWDAHQQNQLIEEFRQFSNKLLERMLARRADARTVLAYSNKSIPQDDSLMLGRWHLDSLRSQLKVFAFLTKTTERSGPLEVISGTHKTLFKATELLRGSLLDLSSIAAGKRAYQQLDDRRVDQILAGRHQATPILCEAGTVVVVNTSAIHRARPCFENGRYALTCYYDHF